MTNIYSAERRARTALVLAGGAAKGSFEAGALATLIEAGARFSRIVGASSGALSGLVLAAAARGGTERDAVRELLELWRERATWGGFVRVNPVKLARAEGLSTTERLEEIARDVVKPCTIASEERRPIEFRAVVTAVCGIPVSIGGCGADATSYEATCTFRNEDFDNETSLARARRGAVASATLPGILVPPEVEGLGQCFDGGMVNNNPISHALGRPEEALDTVVVITPFPATRPASDPPELRGVGLAGHLFEVLINERLFRDLKEASRRNAALEALAGLVANGALTTGQLAAVLEAIGWSKSRQVRIVAVRPPRALEGDALRAFSSRALREDYIESGRRAAGSVVVEVMRE